MICIANSVRTSTRAAPIVAALLLFGASSASYAACSSFQPPPELYVGNKSTDAQCTHTDIQTAIDDSTCQYGTNIYITNEQQYKAVHLNVANKHIALIGRDNTSRCGPATTPVCNGVCAPTTAPLLTLSTLDTGGHATAGSAISVSGDSTVTLRYLDIAGGTTSGDGGGVLFDGAGTLTLDTTWIRGGHASNGGAIAFNGQSASTLTIGPNVLIAGNQADASGGGIAATGLSTINVLGPEAVIEDNLAPNGYGGGIYVYGAATANIGSANTSNPVLFQNQAKYGGGLALVGSSGGVYAVTAQLFSNNPLLPVEVRSNQASHTGGGIYLKPYISVANTSYATVCAFDFSLSDNVAANGSAIYSDSDTSTFSDLGSAVHLNACVLGFDDRTALGGVACTNPNRCGTIDGNIATDPDAAVVLIQDGSSLEGNRVTFTHNQGDYGIRAIDAGNGIALRNCVFADNEFTHELLYLNGNNPLDIEDCTFANDLIGATHVIHAQEISLQTSLFYELGTLALDYTGSIENIYVNYVVSNDITTFPKSDAVIQATAQFVDLAHGDYHLAPTSPGVDFSYGHNDIPALPTVDRDSNPRDIDLPSVPNASGPRDVGAYERQNLFRNCGRADSVFCDGFDW